MSEQNRLLENLQKIDFALVEATLYLDTHPNCAEALAYYRSWRDMREVAAAAYEAAVGPLTALCVPAKKTWEWVATPMPWELEGC